LLDSLLQEKSFDSLYGVLAKKVTNYGS